MKRRCLLFALIIVLVISVFFGLKALVKKWQDNKYTHISMEPNENEEPIINNKITLKAKEIHDYMRDNNYGYCTYDFRCKHDGSCGLNSTFEASKTGYHNTCCATYVSWVLQETGYITKKEHVDNNFNAANNLSKYLSTHGWRALGKDEKLQPGDILCYNHHIAIYAGRGAQYDAGNKELLEFPAPCIINGGMNANNAEKVLRAPDLDISDEEEMQPNEV